MYLSKPRIKVRMEPDVNHERAHVHINEHNASFDVNTGELMEGECDVRTRQTVQNWILRHKGDLLELWDIAKVGIDYRPYVRRIREDKDFTDFGFKGTKPDTCTIIERVKIEDQLTGENCEFCGKPLVIKNGRFGDFIACSGYPECKNTKPIVEKVGVPCPVCGKDLVARRSKKGRLFYGCSGYPECNTVFWNKPVDKKCPDCGSLLTTKGGRSKQLVCSNSECGYTEK